MMGLISPKCLALVFLEATCFQENPYIKVLFLYIIICGREILYQQARRSYLSNPFHFLPRPSCELVFAVVVGFLPGTLTYN